MPPFRGARGVRKGERKEGGAEINSAGYGETRGFHPRLTRTNFRGQADQQVAPKIMVALTPSGFDYPSGKQPHQTTDHTQDQTGPPNDHWHLEQ